MGERTINGVGQTARWTAAARARESTRSDRLFNDPYAALLAGSDGFQLLRHFHTSHASDDGNPFLPIRTRWFDDFVRDGVAAGIRQVVALGAGLDTRAYRIEWPEKVTLFEVDQPVMLSYKRTILERTGDTPRCTLRAVPADLAADWAPSLRSAGFDAIAPTVWFCEGVLFYLPEKLAAGVPAGAAELSAPGSRFAVDLIGTGIFRFPYMQPFLRKLEDADSPWRFGTDDPIGFLAANGWSAPVVTEPGRPDANYGRWPAAANPPGLADLPRSYLAAGSTPGGSASGVSRSGDGVTSELH